MPPTSPRPRLTLSAPLLTVLFGLIAGITGTLVAAAFLVPTPPSSNVVSVLRGQTLTTDDLLAIDRAQKTLVGLAPAKALSQNYSGAYAPSEILGEGAAYTSDGWIMTHANVYAGKGDVATVAKSWVVIVGNRRYSPQSVIVDSYSGVVLLKIAADNLSVASTATWLSTDDQTFAFDAAGGMRRVDVIGIDDQPENTSADFLRSSEREQKILRIAPLAGVPSGAPIFNRNGDVIGLVADANGIGAFAIPTYAFTARVGGALGSGSMPRPYLGVHYVDVSRLPGMFADAPLAAGIGSDRGAFVMSSIDGKLGGVARRSPAEAAGIRNGDVITQVAGEEVSSKRSLSDLIAQYDPGTTIDLTVARDGAARHVSVQLGASH